MAGGGPPIWTPAPHMRGDLATLPGARASTTSDRPPISQLAASGAMGFITALLAIVISGAAGAHCPSFPWLFRFWWDWRR
jgi:hypothetical protein